VIEGAPFAAGEFLSDYRDSDVKRLSGTLAHAKRIGDIPCAAAGIALAMEGSEWFVSVATLSEATDVNGIELPAGSWFERFSTSDTPFAIKPGADMAYEGHALTAGVKVHVHELTNR
jgi:hypothetical protein